MVETHTFFKAMVVMSRRGRFRPSRNCSWGACSDDCATRSLRKCIRHRRESSFRGLEICRRRDEIRIGSSTTWANHQRIKSWAHSQRMSWISYRDTWGDRLLITLLPLSQRRTDGKQERESNRFLRQNDKRYLKVWCIITQLEMRIHYYSRN